MYIINRALKCQVCFLNIISILHKGISSELRLLVNVDAEILSSCLHCKNAFFCRNIILISHNISNTRKSVSSDIQTLRSGLKKRGTAKFFLTNFEVFGYLMKHSLECLI